MELSFKSVFVLLASIVCVCVWVSLFGESVCRRRAFESLLKSAENRKRLAFPFAAASAAHFLSRAETHARRRAAGGHNWAAPPHKHAGRRVTKLEPGKVVS